MDVSATGSFGENPFGDEHAASAMDVFGDRTEIFHDGRFGDVYSVMDISAMDISATHIR